MSLIKEKSMGVFYGYPPRFDYKAQFYCKNTYIFGKYLIEDLPLNSRIVQYKDSTQQNVYLEISVSGMTKDDLLIELSPDNKLSVSTTVDYIQEHKFSNKVLVKQNNFPAYPNCEIRFHDNIKIGAVNCDDGLLRIQLIDGEKQSDSIKLEIGTTK